MEVLYIAFDFKYDKPASNIYVLYRNDIEISENVKVETGNELLYCS
jgi:hypothetical protein